MATETKRTPGLWMRDGTELQVKTEDGYRIVGYTDTSRLDNRHDRTPEDEANAAFIVRACNEHALLSDLRVAMVGIFRSVLEAYDRDQGWPSTVTIDKIRSALALAEGGAT